MPSKEYREYLQTDHWKEFREHALETHGRKCEDCGATDVTLDVHHLTYENIWNEQLEDVVILCRSCHISRHPEKLRRRCKHDNLSKAVGYGSGSMDFYWYCSDCKSLIGLRKPDDKEIKENEKYIKKQKKRLEKEAIKQAEKETKLKEREAVRNEKEKLKPKKKKKRKPYKKRVSREEQKADKGGQNFN